MGADGLPGLIDRLDKHFLRGNGILTLTIIFLTALPLLVDTHFMTISLLQIGLIDNFDPSLCAPIIFAAAVLVPWRIAVTQSHRLATRLGSSDVLARIISGDRWDFDVRARVPGLLRNNMDYPKPPPDSAGGVAGVLWDVGYHLDWFLQPKDRLVRPVWIAGLLIHPINVLYLLFILGMPLFSVAPDSGGFFIPPLGVACAALMYHDLIRKYLWTKLLIRHLRELVA